nr:hypothetical protein [Streptomyces sp. WM6368]
MLAAMTVSMIGALCWPRTAPTISWLVLPTFFCAAKSRFPPAFVVVPVLMPSESLYGTRRFQFGQFLPDGADPAGLLGDVEERLHLHELQTQLHLVLGGADRGRVQTRGVRVRRPGHAEFLRGLVHLLDERFLRTGVPAREQPRDVVGRGDHEGGDRVVLRDLVALLDRVEGGLVVGRVVLLALGLGRLVDVDHRALITLLDGVVAQDDVRRHRLGDARDRHGLLLAGLAERAEAGGRHVRLALGGPRQLGRGAIEGVRGLLGHHELRLGQRAHQLHDGQDERQERDERRVDLDPPDRGAHRARRRGRVVREVRQHVQRRLGRQRLLGGPLGPVDPVEPGGGRDRGLGPLPGRRSGRRAALGAQRHEGAALGSLGSGRLGLGGLGGGPGLGRGEPGLGRLGQARLRGGGPGGGLRGLRLDRVHLGDPEDGGALAVGGLVGRGPVGGRLVGGRLVRGRLRLVDRSRSGRRLHRAEHSRTLAVRGLIGGGPGLRPLRDGGQSGIQLHGPEHGGALTVGGLRLGSGSRLGRRLHRTEHGGALTVHRRLGRSRSRSGIRLGLFGTGLGRVGADGLGLTHGRFGIRRSGIPGCIRRAVLVRLGGGVRAGVGVVGRGTPGRGVVGRGDPCRHGVPQRIPPAGFTLGIGLGPAVGTRTRTGTRTGTGIGTRSGIGPSTGLGDIRLGPGFCLGPGFGPGLALDLDLGLGFGLGFGLGLGFGVQIDTRPRTATGTGDPAALGIARPEHRQPRIAPRGRLRRPRRSFIYRLVGGLARHRSSSIAAMSGCPNV